MRNRLFFLIFLAMFFHHSCSEEWDDAVESSGDSALDAAGEETECCWTCVDSDGGADQNEKGWVELTNPGGATIKHADVCMVGRTSVSEMSCFPNGRAKNDQLLCAEGRVCFDGACMLEEELYPGASSDPQSGWSCEDSDGGDNTQIAGWVDLTDPNGSTRRHTDLCMVDGVTVSEMTCLPDGQAENLRLACGEGFVCQGGACLAVTATP